MLLHEGPGTERAESGDKEYGVLALGRSAEVGGLEVTATRFVDMGSPWGTVVWLKVRGNASGLSVDATDFAFEFQDGQWIPATRLAVNGRFQEEVVRVGSGVAEIGINAPLTRMDPKDYKLVWSPGNSGQAVRWDLSTPGIPNAANLEREGTEQREANTAEETWQKFRALDRRRIPVTTFAEPSFGIRVTGSATITVDESSRGFALRIALQNRSVPNEKYPNAVSVRVLGITTPWDNRILAQEWEHDGACIRPGESQVWTLKITEIAHDMTLPKTFTFMAQYC